MPTLKPTMKGTTRGGSFGVTVSCPVVNVAKALLSGPPASKATPRPATKP